MTAETVERRHRRRGNYVEHTYSSRRFEAICESVQLLHQRCGAESDEEVGHAIQQPYAINKESSKEYEGGGPMRSVMHVLKTLDYLEACGASGAGVTEVANALGVHKSTASRLLASMRPGGYVTRDELTGKYYLGIRLVELAKAKLDQFDLRTYARPYLEELSQLTQETVHLAIMEQKRLVYIDKIDSTHMLIMRSKIGYRISPHCTALGKAILSVLNEKDQDAILGELELQHFTPHTITDPARLKEHLEHVAAQGFACDDEEHEAGIRCVAAPIRDYTNGVLGAISVSAPTTRMSKKRMKEVGLLVKGVCGRLSRSLGYKEGEVNTFPDIP